MILNRVWESTVVVHDLSNLISLHTTHHLQLLQTVLNISISLFFGFPTDSVQFLHIEFDFHPLQYQSLTLSV
jgi:hypothetical protein